MNIDIATILKDTAVTSNALDVRITDKNVALKKFSSIFNCDENTIVWLRKEFNINSISTKNKLVIVEKGFKFKKNLDNYIEVTNPRSVFFSLMKKYNPINRKSGIDFKSNVSKKCKIGKNVYIGAYTTIDDDVEIGDNCTILNGAIISNRVKIGSNCFIKSNSIIGEDGFAVEKDEEGNFFDLPHIGGVIIGNNVKIGSFSTIASGTLDPTIVGNYTKIDDHVHVAHNVKIGEASIITAGVKIGGSVIIEDNVWLGLGSVITDGIKIGSGSFIGAGANVLSSIAKSINLLGTPGKQIFKVKRK